MITLPIQLPKVQINEFCESWKIRELALFGSVLRDDFRPDSDIDVLLLSVPMLIGVYLITLECSKS